MRILLAAVCVVVGVAFLLDSESISKTSRHREVDNPWVTSLHALMKAGGPVQALTVEGAEIGTDSELSTLRRYPVVKFHYDASGRVIKMDDLNEQGGPLTSTHYVYDSGGRLLKQAHRDIAQVVSAEILYKYDSNGRPEEKVQIDVDDGAVLSKETFVYNETTGGTKITSWSGERLRASVEVFRNSRGQIIEVRPTNEPAGSVGGSPSGKVIIAYNDLGDAKAESSFDDGGKLTEEAAYSYEYDAHNNWTRRSKDIKRVTPDGKVCKTREVIHRDITYK